MLRRCKGAERRPSALALEASIHDRLPQRALLDSSPTRDLATEDSVGRSTIHRIIHSPADVMG
ncbi:hypothetical protein [Spirillospora albida]|uniref:hypothetical protein n=1 Tax=Spirillospora albida TaxID=58123 RepID=UPI0004BE65CF|nr:hypothetical protein [Spirillospora albida]